RAASRVRRSKRESWIAAPWHFQQLFSKRGRISVLKETGVCADATAAAPINHNTRIDGMEFFLSQYSPACNPFQPHVVVECSHRNASRKSVLPRCRNPCV